MNNIIKSLKEMFKNFKKFMKYHWKKGTVGKIIVILSSLALLATSVLPYIIG